MDLFELTQAMLVILEAGGFTSGGVNFDAKLRRNSTDPEDLFLAHIGGMDSFARALLTAHRILEESPYREMRRQRYQSFDAGEGKAFAEGKMSLEDLCAYAIEHGEPEQRSGKQELFENLLNRYI
jgi:xylose isomerase